MNKILIAIAALLPSIVLANSVSITINNVHSYTVIRTANQEAKWYGALRTEIKKGDLASLKDCIDLNTADAATYSVSERNKKTWLSLVFKISQNDYWDILNNQSPKTIALCTHTNGADESITIQAILKNSPNPDLYESITEILPQGAEKSLTAVDCLAPSKGRSKCKANPFGCVGNCPDLVVNFKDDSGQATIRYLDGTANSRLTEILSLYPVSVAFNSSTTLSWERKVADTAYNIKSELCLVRPRIEPLEGGYCASNIIKSSIGGAFANLIVVSSDAQSSVFSIGKEWATLETIHITPPLRGVAVSAGVVTDFSKDQNPISSFYYKKFDWNATIPDCLDAESPLLFAMTPKGGCGKTSLSPTGPLGHPAIIPTFEPESNAILCNLGRSMIWTTDWSSPKLTPTTEWRTLLQALKRPIVGLFKGKTANNDNAYVTIACKGENCQYRGPDNWVATSTILSQAVRPLATDDLTPWKKQIELLAPKIGFSSITMEPELCGDTPFPW